MSEIKKDNLDSFAIDGTDFDLTKAVQPLNDDEELYVPYLDEIDQIGEVSEYHYSLQFELDDKRKKAHKAFTQLVKKQKREIEEMKQAEIDMKALHQKQITTLFEKYYGALPKETQNII